LRERHVSSFVGETLDFLNLILDGIAYDVAHRTGSKAHAYAYGAGLLLHRAATERGTLPKHVV
jgi:hypothetical protein